MELECNLRHALEVLGRCVLQPAVKSGLAAEVEWALEQESVGFVVDLPACLKELGPGGRVYQDVPVDHGAEFEREFEKVCWSGVIDSVGLVANIGW